jgi:tetratricopeptide (TPR) repeat protein
MVIDERHDHSFRIPRPDLSVELGVPNPCLTCHAKKSSQWAADRVADWYQHQPMEHFAKALDAGRRGELRAETLLSELNLNNREFSRESIEAGLRDEHPLIRLGAVRGAERLRPETRWQAAHHLLSHPLRAVRIEAGRLLAPVDPESLDSGQRNTLDRALTEYITAQMVNADRPEAHTNVGVIYSQARKFTKAEQAYQQALSLNPQWVPALVNLADLYRAQARDAEGEPFLKRALESEPNNPAIHQAYGLWLTRQGRSQEALENLKRSTQLDPETARYAYVYGIALNSTGQPSEALKVLGRTLTKFPEDLDVLYALVTIHRDQGDIKGAVVYAEKLAALRPDQEYFHQLVKELREQQKPR